MVLSEQSLAHVIVFGFDDFYIVKRTDKDDPIFLW